VKDTIGAKAGQTREPSHRSAAAVGAAVRAVDVSVGRLSTQIKSLERYLAVPIA